MINAIKGINIKAKLPIKENKDIEFETVNVLAIVAERITVYKQPGLLYINIIVAGRYKDLNKLISDIKYSSITKYSCKL